MPLANALEVILDRFKVVRLSKKSEEEWVTASFRFTAERISTLAKSHAINIFLVFIIHSSQLGFIFRELEALIKSKA